MTELEATLGPRVRTEGQDHLDRMRVDFETRAGEAQQIAEKERDRFYKAREKLRLSYRALEELHTLLQKCADNPELFKPEEFRRVAAYIDGAMSEVRSSGLM